MVKTRRKRHYGKTKTKTMRYKKGGAIPKPDSYKIEKLNKLIAYLKSKKEICMDFDINKFNTKPTHHLVHEQNLQYEVPQEIEVDDFSVPLVEPYVTSNEGKTVFSVPYEETTVGGKRKTRRSKIKTTRYKKPTQRGGKPLFFTRNSTIKRKIKEYIKELQNDGVLTEDLTDVKINDILDNKNCLKSSASSGSRVSNVYSEERNVPSAYRETIKVNPLFDVYSEPETEEGEGVYTYQKPSASSEHKYNVLNRETQRRSDVNIYNDWNEAVDPLYNTVEQGSLTYIPDTTKFDSEDCTTKDPFGLWVKNEAGKCYKSDPLYATIQNKNTVRITANHFPRGGATKRRRGRKSKKSGRKAKRSKAKRRQTKRS